MSTPDTSAGGEPGPGARSPMPNVPRGLVFAAAVGWRLLVVIAVVGVLAWGVAQLRVAWLAILLAIFATAILKPVVRRLIERGAPAGIAAAGVVASSLAAFGGLMWLIAPVVADQLDDLSAGFTDGLDAAREWLTTGPLGLSEEEVDERFDDAVAFVEENTDAIASGVLTGAQVAVEVIAAFLISIVLTFFLLKDGERMWDWFVGLISPAHQHDARQVGERSWGALSGYLRGMTVVATFDAAFIGLALVILGVPAALPLALATFIGAYIPIAGAFVTGLAAVVVALVSEGLITALLVLAAVIIVQQTESNLLHPVVVGRAVAIHPVAILMAVTVGALVGGIPGAFVAVPLTAMLTRAGEYLRERSEQPGGVVTATHVSE